MLKAIQVAQFEGFGNMTPKSLSEYYRAMGASKGAAGIVFNKFVLESLDLDYNSVAAKYYAYAKGNINNITGEYLYLLGDNFIYTASYGAPYGITKYFPLPNSGFSGGAIVGDPKGRLLLAGDNQLVLHDSTITDVFAGTVSTTNGSDTITGSGTSWDASLNGKRIRIGNDNVGYTVLSVGSATSITLTTNYSGTTGSGKSYNIFKSWDLSWKVFGSSINSYQMQVETYESTVLFGRLNNIITLDVNTDTMTSDSSPSFSMPSGYINKAISANRSGILMWFDSYEGSVLVLWDNQSIRSVAPWIKLKDPIKAICKYSSGWIVMTTRSVYYTDGYSLTLLIPNYLDSENMPLNIKSAEAVNNYVFFTLMGNQNIKQRDGLYKLNLKTGLVEYYGTYNMSQVYNTNYTQIFLVPKSNYLMFCDGQRNYLVSDDIASTSRVFSYITNPIAKSATKKSAKKIAVPIAIDQTFSSNGFTDGFKIQCYVNPMKSQNRYQVSVSTTQTDYSKLRVNKTNLYKVNNSIEFTTGVNAGQVRYIKSITDLGSEYEFTLNAPLANYSSYGDQIEYTPFSFVGEYTLNMTQARDYKNLIFTVKEDLVGVGFMVKFVVSGMVVPIEILPFLFFYDDVGTL